MIKHRIRRQIIGLRRRKGQDTEAKWYAVRRYDCGMPPFRPSGSEKIFGLLAAGQEKARSDAALTEEERKTIEHRIEETTAPSRYRPAGGPPKYDPRKFRS